MSKLNSEPFSGFPYKFPHKFFHKFSRRFPHLSAWLSRAFHQHLVLPVTEIGNLLLFLVDGLKLVWSRPYRWKEFLSHFHFIGNQSLVIILVTGAFTGLALTLQTYIGFKRVNAVNLIGPVVALSVTRELGPVLTGLIVAARAGGAMAARLGTMRVSEQIDAMEVMGVHVRQYLISPRIYAAFFACPLLTVFFDTVAIWGSYVMVTQVFDLDGANFWRRIFEYVDIKHILEGVFKATFFGLIFTMICTYRGFFTKGGAKGVGEATNKSVVYSMVSIIVFDYFLTILIRIYYNII